MAKIVCAAIKFTSKADEDNIVVLPYKPENDAGLVVKFYDKDSPFISKTFIIRIEDADDKEVTKEEI